MTKSKLTLRLAHINELAWIMQEINACRPLMKQMGSDQWQGNEPSYETLSHDVLSSQFYLLMDEGQPVGGTAVLSHESAYDHLLSGAWINQDPYAVLHRFFIAPKVQRQGLGQAFLKEIEAMMPGLGVRNIRLDTHMKNLPMRRLLARMEYVEVGVVDLPKAGHRLVYHKVLGDKHESK